MVSVTWIPVFCVLLELCAQIECTPSGEHVCSMRVSRLGFSLPPAPHQEPRASYVAPEAPDDDELDSSHRHEHRHRHRGPWHRPVPKWTYVLGCCEGYRETQDNLCVPDCPGCQSGACVAPNTCSTCKPRYIKNSKNECESPCSIGCVNGICNDQDICTCNAGYHMDSVSGECILQGCQCDNGKCTAAGTCNCDDGYKLDPNAKDRCIPEPECFLECENGYCSSQDNCTCNNGYKKDTTHTNICVPMCSETCGNGKCTGPNFCTCNEGYEKNITHSPVCQAKCNEKCINSECTAPNVCTCISGFKQNNVKRNVCDWAGATPCATSCNDGKCEHGKCVCNQGYQYSKRRNSCKPKCSRDCPFGFCSAPETCSCENGYVISTVEWNKCEPAGTCSSTCKNGQCNDKGMCVCDVGFQLSHSVHNTCEAAPLCAVTCENGACDAQGVCVCPEGYVTSMNGNTCVAEGTKECNNGRFVAPDSCVCNTGFKSTADGKRCIPEHSIEVAHPWRRILNSDEVDDEENILEDTTSRPDAH